MEEGQYPLYVALLVSVMLVVVVVLGKHRPSGNQAAHKLGLRLPPGPWQLPVLGTLHHLAFAGQLPHHAIRDLARRHGPVMLLRNAGAALSIWLRHCRNGEVATVVVTSREAAREVMRTHDAAFASRPRSATVRALTSGGRDLMFAPIGDHWGQLRRVVVTELLSARRVQSFRHVREQEVAAMLKACAATASVARSIEMRERLAVLVANVMARVLIGDRCSGEDRNGLLRALDDALQLAAGFNPADLWPSSWLVRTLSSSVRRAHECQDAVYGILDGIIKEHLDRTMDSGSAGVLGAPEEELLDVLLKIHKDGGLQVPLDMEVIKLTLFEIFGAGSKTMPTTLEWAMVELIRHPKAMARVTAEVRHAFAAQGTVHEQGLHELCPYLHLVIKETLRLHAPVPLLLPRECPQEEPCRVLGYDVPRGSNVLVNVWAMGRDDRYWPGGDPEEFRPERFEDFKGGDFEFLPFGAGRRICPGIAFGFANMELTLASLLFHFDWEAPAELDMTEVLGITVRRKSDLPLRPIPRVPLPPPTGAPSA